MGAKSRLRRSKVAALRSFCQGSKYLAEPQLTVARLSRAAFAGDERGLTRMRKWWTGLSRSDGDSKHPDCWSSIARQSNALYRRLRLLIPLQGMTSAGRSRSVKVDENHFGSGRVRVSALPRLRGRGTLKQPLLEPRGPFEIASTIRAMSLGR